MPSFGYRTVKTGGQTLGADGRWYSSPAAAARGPKPTPRRRAYAKRQKDTGVIAFLRSQ